MEKNQEKKSQDNVLAERTAAHMLMMNWVKENAGEVANALEDLIPFMVGECNLTNLNSDLNIVNTTFATIALEVIKANNRDSNDLCLPVDANRMQNTIYDLTKFFRILSRLDTMLQINRDNPAFRMCMSAFDEVEIYG